MRVELSERNCAGFGFVCKETICVTVGFNFSLMVSSKMHSDGTPLHDKRKRYRLGLCQRMGRFNPLLPLGTSRTIERLVRFFQAAGMGDILVVTDHRATEVHPEGYRFQGLNLQHSQKTPAARCR